MLEVISEEVFVDMIEVFEQVPVRSRPDLSRERLDVQAAQIVQDVILFRCIKVLLHAFYYLVEPDAVELYSLRCLVLTAHSS